ncbi:formyltransferase family protein [Enterovirga sp.]|uniref:formyltransferase family protein n=1 Tax=Enterovirga sp. TaxID=2026350 RepID=UPI002612D8DE|nr:formyltransferase family protein [Enterovirga sp.]MDB5591166.1 formyl transferase domain protein [Enterovirga sp.]
MRIALLTLEAVAASRAVRRFVAAEAGRIALVGLSDPYRGSAGGASGQLLRRLRLSGPRILPYLAANFTAPRLAGLLRRPPADDGLACPLPLTCRRLGIPVLVVDDVNGPAFRQALAQSGADLLVSFHFDQILSAELIAAPRLGGINVHAGLLPDHRGPVPTIHALLDDPVRFGVSVHRLAPRIDAGALLAQAEMGDEPGLSALSAAARLHEAALPLLARVLADLETGRAAERPLPLQPYRPFPTGAELRRLARKGRRLAGWHDLAEAWRLPVRDRA